MADNEKKKADKLAEKQRERIHYEMLQREKKHRKELKIAPEGVYLSLQHINKIYDNHVQAVYDFSLDVKQHEFIVLVGPSGCGKSTTLRMIAGLEDITAGDLYIEGKYANDIPAMDRGIAMVFQSYALYPHMTVEQNLAFSLQVRKFPYLAKDNEGNPLKRIDKKAIRSLAKQISNLREYYASLTEEDGEEEKQKVERQIDELCQNLEELKVTPREYYVMRHMPKAEIKERVLKAAKALQIEDYLDRKPKALSGGQRQRVALGRAIVRNAKVFLMDEPLSNLDAKLRVQMRSQIIKLHQSLGATTVYVTHDQTEAMTMATRIVVMNKGHIQQIAAPIDIYNHPANLFVATFIGSPAMNFLKSTFQNKEVTFPDGKSILLPEKDVSKMEDFYAHALNKAEEKLEDFDKTFVERNKVLDKMKEERQKLALETDESKKSAIEERIQKLEEEKTKIENASEDRVQIVHCLEKYKDIDPTKPIPVIFGIRPEDIYQADKIKETATPSQVFSIKVTVSELLGKEFYLHTDFSGIDLVAKVSSKQLIESGVDMEIVFDLDRIHIFDSISEDVII